MTELREPQKVLDRANGQPVAILKNSALVGYLVPAEAVTDITHRYATVDEEMESLERTRARAQPVLDYLKDK
jgi:antitoxin StbD